MNRFLLFIVLFLGSSAYAEEIRVGYGDFRPMAFGIPADVIDSDGGITQNDLASGFDVDLINAIAANSGFKVRYIKYHSMTKLLEALRANEIDVAASGLTITSSRELEFDFTHPYFDSGLKILTRAVEPSIGETTRKIIEDNKLGKALLYFILFMILCSHILWFTERGADDQVRDKYFPGIFDALWCVFAIMTTIGFGDIAPKKALGRIMTVAIATSGIAFFGWFVTVFAVSFNSSIESKPIVEVESLEELKGLKVATRLGTTSHRAIDTAGGETIPFKTMRDIKSLFDLEKVDLLLYDAPYVMHTLKIEGEESPYVTTDVMFKKQQYGFAVQEGDKLRESFNRSLVKLKENGTYDIIYKKWFGDNQ